MTVDVSDMDLDNMDGFSRRIDKPGFYHLVAVDINPNDGTDDAVIITSQALAGTHADQVGNEHREYFHKSENPNCRKRILIMALALKITSIDYLKDCKAKGRAVDLPWEDGEGRHYCSGLKEDNYNGKVRYQQGFDIWPTDDPKSKDVPKDTSCKPIPEFAAVGAATGGDDGFGGAFD
jgi:hypothetical protein